MQAKSECSDLAIFGGNPTFSTIRSTSNLVKPDTDVFFSYAKKSFDSRWLTNNGLLVQTLEKRLAHLHNTKHCVTFCNGLWGLVLCMKQLALPGKTQVILPSMTYRRLADIVAWAEMVPHFCDVDAQMLGVSAATVESCITDETALILVAQPIVNICDMDELSAVAHKHDIPILFDSVEAAYASYKGKMIGSFGNAECFSMHASKLINGFEGGYMTTDDAMLADSVKKARAFGFSGPDNVETLGLNAKLNEIHAAMALTSLDDLDDQIIRNRKRYQAYCDYLEPVVGIEIVKYDEIEIRGFKNILVKLNDRWPISRQDTLDILHAENMLARPYYYPPLHKMNASYPTIKPELPVSELLTQNYLLLPSGQFVSSEDIQAITALLGFIQSSNDQLDLLLEQRFK